ncbi:MAG TPA: hypothetical protein VMU41_06190 [Candidatus Binataceae bacterium]|nr:hypothetical protein [Candidatus Binataceae bacterium]
MAGHKEKPIADMINSVLELQNKWNQLILTLETQVRDEFKQVLGVPVPSSMMCDVYHFDCSAQTAASADVEEYKNGANAMINTGFRANWPQLALDVVATVFSFAGKVIEAIKARDGFSPAPFADVYRRDASNSKGEKKSFIIACYSVAKQCNASDWRLDRNFYAASHVLAVWAPTPPHLELISTRLARYPQTHLLR